MLPTLTELRCALEGYQHSPHRSVHLNAINNHRTAVCICVLPTLTRQRCACPPKFTDLLHASTQSSERPVYVFQNPHQQGTLLLCCNTKWSRRDFDSSHMHKYSDPQTLYSPTNCHQYLKHLLISVIPLDTDIPRCYGRTDINQSVITESTVLRPAL